MPVLKYVKNMEKKKMARGIFNIQSDLDYYDDIRLNHSKVST